MKPVRLAAGGHATVWLARSGGDLVARKLPHAHLMDDPEMRAALRREAEIALRLRHPNVVRLRGIELEDEVPVLVMDYVEGTTLSELVRDWIKQSQQSQGDTTATARAAVRIILDAAEGLHALHELAGDRGEPLALVHRDVSPQNLLVGVDGRARVSDFGLTKCLSTDRATTEGVLKGKAGYLAPEYIRGGRGDRRQDVFSLAIVAWEALTRGRLFRGENDAQTLDRVLTMPIPSVADKSPSLASAAVHLDPVLRRALERDPSERYESAAAFGHSLAVAAERAGLLGTESDVRQSFSPALAETLLARRAALVPKRRGGAALAGAGAVIAVVVLALIGVRAREPVANVKAEPPTPTSASAAALPVALPFPLPPAEPLASTSAPTSGPVTEVMALPNAKRDPAPAARSKGKTPSPTAVAPAKSADLAPAKPRPNPY